MSGQEIVDNQALVWRAIDELCSGFTEAQWKLPTDCPGWSVQDQLSHLASAESRFLERPEPDHAPSDLSHVKNDIGKRNEAMVDRRRSWPGAKVLEEFRGATEERLSYLRGLQPTDFEKEVMTPIGPGDVSEQLRIRVFDAWVHEQDMRRAVGRPGHLEGPVAEHAMGRAAMAMPFVVGKKATAPDGATVVFDVASPAGGVLPIAVEGGRAKRLDAAPSGPTITLTMDFETFMRLGCGRWDPDEALASGKVSLVGDRALGETIVRQMNFMP